MTDLLSRPTPAPEEAPVRRAPRRRWTRLGPFALRWCLLLLLAVLWELVTLRVSSPYFPRMSVILGRVRDLWFSGGWETLLLSDAVWRDVVPSMTRLLLGWGIAALVGVGVGVALGLARRLAPYVDPVVHFIRAIPPPALIPMFILLLGIRDTMKVTLIAIGVVWPILLNTIDGVRSVEETQRQTGRIYGIVPRRQLTHIVIPAAMPKVFAGLRVSLSLALILMVISEMYAATDGIGFTIVSAQRGFRLTDMWAGIVLLGGLGYMLNAILVMVEDRVLRWHRGARGGGT